MIVTHPLDYIQHYHHLLNPDPSSSHQNIVEVPLPLVDNLPGAMEELVDPKNRRKVERIAENSWKDMRERWISPAAKYVQPNARVSPHLPLAPPLPRISRRLSWQYLHVFSSAPPIERRAIEQADTSV